MFLPLNMRSDSNPDSNAVCAQTYPDIEQPPVRVPWHGSSAASRYHFVGNWRNQISIQCSCGA